MLRKLCILLLFNPFITLSQIDLNIAEDYLNGDSKEIYQELDKKGYIIKDTTIFENGDLGVRYVQEDGFEDILLVSNHGILFFPKKMDNIDLDYFLKYFNSDPLKSYFNNENSDQVNRFSYDTHGNQVITTYNGFTYIIEKNSSYFFIVTTDFHNKNSLFKN